MPFGQHEPVGIRPMRVARVEPHFREKGHGRELRRRAAARGMPTAGFGRAFNGMNAKAGRDVLQGVNESGVCHPLIVLQFPVDAREI